MSVLQHVSSVTAEVTTMLLTRVLGILILWAWAVENKRNAENKLPRTSLGIKYICRMAHYGKLQLYIFKIVD